MKTVPIGDLTSTASKWDPRKDASGSFRYIDLASVDRDLKAITGSESVDSVDAPSRARQLVGVGDVLVSTVRPNLNAVAMVDGAHDGATASTGFCVLRPGTMLDGRYLFHWVRSRRFVDEMARLATGASYPAVSDKIVKASHIPLPSIEEQRRIAAVLDAADDLRTKRRQALAKLDTLTQAIFIDMFGDPIAEPRYPTVRIGDVAASATYGTSKKAGTTGEFAVLRMGNITYDGLLDLTSLKYVDLDLKEQPKHLVRAGDLLFNRTNSADLVGKTAVYRLDEPMAYAGYLIRLRLGERMTPEFLGQFMNLPSGASLK